MISRIRLLLAIGGLGVLTASADAFVGVSMTLAAQAAEQHANATTSRGILKNPGSFIVVRKVQVEEPVVEAPQAQASTGRLIAVPDNARAGDPAYATLPEEEYDDYGYYYDDQPVVFGPYGTVFADGIDLGYSALKKHGHHRRHQHRDRGRSRGDDRIPEFGADDPHRSAQLQFAEAAAAGGVTRADAGFRRAQLQFHRATLTPGVQRQADGLRHERSGGPGGAGGQGRAGRPGQPHPSPRR